MTILKIIEALEAYTQGQKRPEFDDAVEEAARLLVEQGEQIADMQDERKWIPVEERLPVLLYSERYDDPYFPEDSWVARKSGKHLALMKNGEVIVAEYWVYDAGDRYFATVTSDYEADCITHWMPIPDAPKEEDKPPEQEEPRQYPQNTEIEFDYAAEDD